MVGYRSYSQANNLWTLAEGSYETIMHENGVRPEDKLVVFSSQGNLIRLSETNYQRDDQHFALFPHTVSFRLKTDDYMYWIDGNLFAAPIGTWSESESYQGIDASQTGIWNIDTGELIGVVPQLGQVELSPDQTKIAVSNQIYDITTGERLAVLQNDTYRVLSAVDDRILQYEADGSLRLLDALSQTEIAILPMQVHELATIQDIFSDDSFLMLHQNQRLAIRISGTTGQEIARYESESPFSIVASKQDGTDEHYLIASANGLMRIWNAESGQELYSPENFSLIGFFSETEVYGWSGKGLSVIAIETGEARELLNLTGTIYADMGRPGSIILSSDRQYVALMFNGTGLVYRLDTGEILLENLRFASFSPSAEFLSYGRDEQPIQVIRLIDRSLVWQMEFDLSAPYTVSAVLPTDSLISITRNGIEGAYDSYTYNFMTGLPQERYFFPQAAPEPFAESNGLRFYSNNGIRIEWNEQPISLTLNPVNFSAASLGSDGSRLYISYTDGRIGIWAVGE